MGIFRRSMSSSSSASYSSTAEVSSGAGTPRTSVESLGDDEISASLLTIRKGAVCSPPAPILRLPLELVQHISKYLDTASAASFCLSSRYIYYALGTAVLSKHVEASNSRFEKRRTIEAVVERAFPGHFFCAWCDQFHSWSPNDGPTSFSSERKRNCADFNSYLCAPPSYTLCYHHIRLAINHYLWGPAHGIPLSAFTHTSSSMARVFRTPVPVKLNISARICPDTKHFLVHTSMAVILPSWCAANKHLLKNLWPILPHILTGHRATDNGHTGLMAALDNVVRRGWKYPFTQSCSLCKSDWSVSCHEFPHSTGSQVRLVVQTWRDLGDGRNPFESSWRAHGVFVTGRESSSSSSSSAAVFATETVRLAGEVVGDVRKRFESAELEEMESVEPTALESYLRSRSLSRNRIYRSFMRTGESTEGASEVRRSRATRSARWDRTRQENEDAERKEEEARIDLSRRVVEDLVRLDTVCGRQQHQSQYQHQHQQ